MRLAFVLVGEAKGPCFGDDNVHPQGEDCGMGKATAGHRRVHRPVLSGGEVLEDSTFIGWREMRQGHCDGVRADNNEGIIGPW
jgi:hypothetical protein